MWCQGLIYDNGLSSGQHLLLIGASGGVGHVALQVAKSVGAKVTAVCSSRNSELVKRLGADRIVDYTNGDVEAQLRQAVAQDGKFDLCFDTVSSLEEKVSVHSLRFLLALGLIAPVTVLVLRMQTRPDPLAQDRKLKYEQMVREKGSTLLSGKYITIGGGALDWTRAGLKRIAGISLFPSSRELFWVRFPASAGALERLGQLADEGKVRPVIDAEVRLEDGSVRDAFARLHARRTVGKLVITMPSQSGGAAM